MGHDLSQSLLANQSLHLGGIWEPPTTIPLPTQQLHHEWAPTHRVDSRFAPSQWESALLCNDISHWLGASLISALYKHSSVFIYSNKRTYLVHLRTPWAKEIDNILINVKQCNVCIPWTTQSGSRSVRAIYSLRFVEVNTLAWRGHQGMRQTNGVGLCRRGP